MSLYECADCATRFEVAFTDEETTVSISEGRQDACPSCGRRVGWSQAECSRCRHVYEVRLPHWHRHCDLVSAKCPMCGETLVDFCSCGES